MIGALLGSLATAGASLFNQNKQENLQREFAQNALQWKAKDAEAAGISKIFAMGAPTVSYAPVSTGGAFDFTNLGNALDKRMGQGGPGSTTTGKINGLNAEMAAAQLDGVKTDNLIKKANLASTIAKATQPGAQGVVDRDVTTGPDGVTMKREIAPASLNQPHRSYGVAPEVDLYRTNMGYAPQIPKDLQEAFESDMLGRWQWNYRNRIAPFFDPSKGTYPDDGPPGGYWFYNPALGVYQERFDKPTTPEAIRMRLRDEYFRKFRR